MIRGDAARTHGLESSGEPAGFIAAVVRIVGVDQVECDAGALAAASRATFPTRARHVAIVRPGSVAEIRAVMRFATQHRVPIHPTSGGKNWGYGSRTPPVAHGILLDLGRLDRILAVQEELGYAIVQPGVSFAALDRALIGSGSRLFLNAPGSSPACSIIGNAVERGLLRSRTANREAAMCDLEVVLPNGDLIETGLSRWPGARAAGATRAAPGPLLDGLFTQSNLGIVTRATVWLDRFPPFWQHFEIPVEGGDLPATLDRLRALMQEGTLDLPVTLHNAYRLIAERQGFPFAQVDAQSGLAGPAFAEIKARHGLADWLATGAVRGGALAIVNALRTRVQAVFGAARFEAINQAGAIFGRPDPAAPRLGGAYWRKRSVPGGAQDDPDRDRCGLIWLAPLSPLDGGAVAACLGVLESAIGAYGFEPAAVVHCATERAAHIVASIAYDRDDAGEEERAMQCHDRAVAALHAAGFVLYRHAHCTAPVVSRCSSMESHRRLVADIKHLVDGAGILSPGRYDAVGAETVSSERQK
jgi:4-cresol dehydrogenase (hydroxylating)